nr:hypothetical protein [Tanacetum cinerariifolium]
VFNSPMLHVLRIEMVINSPWMLSENWLVQKQTTFGKDSSNPFMADNLPKIVKGLIFQSIFESLVRNVDSSSKFYMYPRVGKGFSRVKTPLFETMLAVRDVTEEAEAQILAQGDNVQEHAEEEVAIDVVPPTPTSPSPSPSSPVIPFSPPHQSPCLPQPQAAKCSSHVFQQVLDTCSAFVLRVEGLENANDDQQLEIVKLKARVKKLERLNKVKSSKLRRLKKTDEGVELVIDQEKDAEVEGRHADKQAEIYNIDLDHSSKVLSMQEDDTEVQEAVKVVTTAKLISEVVTAAATQDVAASTPILVAKPKTLKIAAAPAELHTDTLAETPIVKDKGKGILIEDPKPMKKKNQ